MIPHVVTELMQGIAMETGFEVKDVVLNVHLGMESSTRAWARLSGADENVNVKTPPLSRCHEH